MPRVPSSWTWVQQSPCAPCAQLWDAPAGTVPTQAENLALFCDAAALSCLPRSSSRAAHVVRTAAAHFWRPTCPYLQDMMEANLLYAGPTLCLALATGSFQRMSHASRLEAGTLLPIFAGYDGS